MKLGESETGKFDISDCVKYALLKAKYVVENENYFSYHNFIRTPRDTSSMLMAYTLAYI